MPNMTFDKQGYHLFEGGDGISQSTPLVNKRNVLEVAAVATQVVNALLVSFSIKRSVQTLHKQVSRLNKHHYHLPLFQQLVSWSTWVSRFPLGVSPSHVPHQYLQDKWYRFSWTRCPSCHPTHSVWAAKETKHWPQPVSWPHPSSTTELLMEEALLRLRQLSDTCNNHYYYNNHHNRCTALFPGPPGWAGARRELLDFMGQGEINRGRHTDHPAGCHSIRTNQCPPPPRPPAYFYGPDALPAVQSTVSKHWMQLAHSD